MERNRFSGTVGQRKSAIYTRDMCVGLALTLQDSGTFLEGTACCGPENSNSHHSSGDHSLNPSLSPKGSHSQPRERWQVKGNPRSPEHFKGMTLLHLELRLVLILGLLGGDSHYVTN